MLSRDYQMDCLVMWKLIKHYLYTNFGIFCKFLLWVFKGCNDQVSNLLIVSVTDAAWYVSLYRCTRGVCVATWDLDTSCYQRSLDTSGGYWLCSSGCGMYVHVCFLSYLFYKASFLRLNNLTACLLGSKLQKYREFISKPRNSACVYYIVFHCQSVIYLFASMDSAHYTHHKHALSSVLHHLSFFSGPPCRHPVSFLHIKVSMLASLCAEGSLWSYLPFLGRDIVTVLLNGRIESLNRYQILLGVAGYALKNVDVW